jgi:clan AA aspartic protease
LGTFYAEIAIGDPQGQRFETIQALVDTGATYTVLPTSLLRRLGVRPHTQASFHYADGREQAMDVGRTWVRINGAVEMTLVVFGGEGTDPLLGAYTMEGLRLAPDPVNQRLVPVPGLLM